MNGVIGDILPLAIGVAISPIPIIAAILMLFSANAGRTSAGFLIGWVAGIVVATGLFTALAGSLGGSDQPTGGELDQDRAGRPAADGGPAPVAGPARRARPAEVDGRHRSDGLRAGARARLRAAAIDPKNLLMAVAAGVAIGSGGLGVGGDVVAVVIFTVIAAATVAVPVIAYAVAKERMREPLAKAKGWLEENNATVMAVLLLVIGVTLIGKGLGGL